MESFKTIYGGNAPNIIANTLGDYTARYTPKLDPNHPEVLNLYDRYDFVGKMGEGKGSAYDINVNLPPELLAKIKKHNISRRETRFKQQQLMNRRKQQMQQTIRQHEAIEAAKKAAIRPTNVPGTPIVPTGGGGGGYQPTTRAQNVARTASRVGPGGNIKAYGLASGGLANLYRYGGF